MNTWDRQTWLNAATLDSMSEVNEEILWLLRAQCSEACPQPPLIQDLRDSLLKLDTASMQRAAGAAVLLVDAGFGQAARWSDAIIGAVNDRPAAASQAFFTVAAAVRVMRLVMTHAWHLARSEPAAARLLFGLSANTVAVIGGSSLSRLIGLAEARTEWLRPRWENRPKVWRDLLHTAAAAGPGVQEQLRIRGLQLLAAEVRASGP